MSHDRARALVSDTTGLLAAALFLCALLYGVQAVQRSLGVDYYQFWVMSRAASGPARDTLYTVETSQRVGLENLERARSLPESARFRDAAEWNQRTNPDLLDPISTPFYYAVIGSLASGDYDRDYFTYQLLGSLTFVLGLIGLCRMLGYSWPGTLLAGTLILLWFGPLQSDVQAANVNRLQFAGGVAALAALHRSDARGVFIGGVLTALLVVFKPNLALVPVLLLATWALRGRGRDLRFGIAGLGTGSLLGIGAGSWFFASVSCWLDWFAVTQRLLAKPYPLENFNVSAVSLIHSLTSVNVSIWLLLAILAGYCACLFRGGRRGAAFHDDVLAVGAGCVVPLISVQIAWDHYFLLALPLLLHFLRPDASPRRRVLSVAVLLLLAQSPLNVVLPLQSAQQVAIAFAIGTSTLLALALRDAARS